MSKPLHVVIVGAGLAGLAIAQGLKKNGISYVIVDREMAPRDRNWGVTISWSHPHLEKLLPKQLYDQLWACQPDPSLDTKEAGRESVLIRDGQNGETMLEPRFPGIRRMSIQKTRSMWSKDVNIKFGKHLSTIDITPSGPVADFDDGTSEAGTVIVGADGGASAVRRWLLGDLATPDILPYVFMNFPVRYTADQALFIDRHMHPIVDVGVHPKSMYIGIFLLDKPELERPETWIFYLLVTWPKKTKEDEENPGNRLERLRARMDDWADPYKSAVAWIPDDTPIRADAMKIWNPKPWNNFGGQVTLAGDAAHSMTFHRGQGGNNAFCDSGHFVNAMISVQQGGKSLKEAVEEYDKGVLCRGQAEVEISRVQTDATHDHANYLKSPITTFGLKPTVS